MFDELLESTRKVEITEEDTTGTGLDHDAAVVHLADQVKEFVGEDVSEEDVEKVVFVFATTPGLAEEAVEAVELFSRVKAELDRKGISPSRESKKVSEEKSEEKHDEE